MRSQTPGSRRTPRLKRTLCLLLCLILIIPCTLTACGIAGAASSGPPGVSSSALPEELTLCGVKEEDLPGMARICLYCSQGGRAFDQDLEVLKERVSVFSGGKYAWAATGIRSVDADGNGTEESYPAVEFYLPQACFEEDLPLEVCRFLISRPVDLWIADAGGTEDDYSYDSMIAVPREAIESAEVQEGCPPGVVPFDYGIERDSFTYVKVVLSASFCEENPEIRTWKEPNFLHDTEGFDSYYHTRAVPGEDGRTFYLTGFAEDEREGRDGDASSVSRRYAETIAYDYSHAPLTQAYYFTGIPGVRWEVPGDDGGTGQVSADAFARLSRVYICRMKEEICTDGDWEQAEQAVRERLDALGVPYALGQVDMKERVFAIRAEYRQGMDDLMDLLVLNGPEMQLSSMGKEISLYPGDAAASVVRQGDRYVLALDLSAHRKDVLNHLSSLSDDPAGARIVLSFGTLLTRFPFLWTSSGEVIRDGRITLDHSAFTGEEGMAEKDRSLADLAAVFLSGTPLPMDEDHKPRVTLEQADSAELDADGHFCLLDHSDGELDYSARFRILKEKAAPFDPLSSGEGHSSYSRGPGTFIVQFKMPQEDTEAAITDQFARMLPVFRDEIFELHMNFDWIDRDGGHIRLNCSGSYDAPGRIGIYIIRSSGIRQEQLETLRETLENDGRLRGRIRIEYTGTL